MVLGGGATATSMLLALAERGMRHATLAGPRPRPGRRDRARGGGAPLGADGGGGAARRRRDAGRRRAGVDRARVRPGRPTWSRRSPTSRWSSRWSTTRGRPRWPRRPSGPAGPCSAASTCWSHQAAEPGGRDDRALRRAGGRDARARPRRPWPRGRRGDRPLPRHRGGDRRAGAGRGRPGAAADRLGARAGARPEPEPEPEPARGSPRPPRPAPTAEPEEPKELYADIAARPGLLWKCCAGLGGQRGGARAGPRLELVAARGAAAGPGRGRAGGDRLADPAAAHPADRAGVRRDHRDDPGRLAGGRPATWQTWSGPRSAGWSTAACSSCSGSSTRAGWATATSGCPACSGWPWAGSAGGAAAGHLERACCSAASSAELLALRDPAPRLPVRPVHARRAPSRASSSDSLSCPPSTAERI